MGDRKKRRVEMLRFIYWLVSSFRSEPKEYTLVELYDDRLWP